MKRLDKIITAKCMCKKKKKQKKTATIKRLKNEIKYVLTSVQLREHIAKVFCNFIRIFHKFNSCKMFAQCPAFINVINETLEVSQLTSRTNNIFYLCKILLKEQL